MFKSIVCSAFALVALTPTSGFGAPPTPTDDVADGLPITAPWFRPEVTNAGPPKGGVYHNPGVLFINFDGAQMQTCGGSNDPVNNCSTIMSDVVEPWGQGTSARNAVVQMMQADVQDFAYDVVGERPMVDNDYDMVMVGDWNPPPMDGGFAGVAPTIDCWNATRGETAFTLDFSSASLVAKITGQEAAHVWGLEHVDSSSDLLFPTTGGASDPRFEDACHQIVVLDGGITPSEANCPDMHLFNCPGQPDHQNSYQDLMMVFGPRGADTTPPQLTIVSPTEGQVFPSGAKVDVLLEMVDDVAPPIFDVWMALDSADQGDKLGGTSTHYPGPSLTVPISGLPDGDHSLRVDLGDMAGNQSVVTVSFVIGMSGGTSDSGESDSSSGATTDSGGSSTSDGSGGTQGDSGPADPSASAGGTDAGSGSGGDSAGGAGGDGGCACAGPGTRPPALLGMLAFLGMVRPRRRCTGP